MGRANFNTLPTDLQAAAAIRSLSRNFKPHPQFHTPPTIPWTSAPHFVAAGFRISPHRPSHPFLNLSRSTISHLPSRYRSNEATNDPVTPSPLPICPTTSAEDACLQQGEVHRQPTSCQCHQTLL